MRKTFKYRIFPTKAQQTSFEKTLNACCWVYNRTLEVRKTAWETRQESISRYDTNKLLTQWKKDNPWLTQPYSQVLQEAQKRVDEAYRAFFRRTKAGDPPGYPKFHARRYYTSFTYPQAQAFRLVDDETLWLSKNGNVRIRLHRPIEGQAKTLTITKDNLGRWYACFSCIVEPHTLPDSPQVIGIDVGLATFATLSNGEKIDNPRFFKQDEKALNKMRSRRDKAVKGSSEWRKLCRAVLHIEDRIKQRRTDFAHKLSRQLVDRYQVIVFEDLDIPDMQSNNWRTMNRSIADVAWGQFIRFTQAKALEAGRSVILVKPRGTTQECSSCGETVPKDLSVRVHNCPHCHCVLDRDLNAARNILARGLACFRADTVRDL